MRRRLRTTLVTGILTLVGWGCDDTRVSAPPAGESPVYHLLDRSVHVGASRLAASAVDVDVTFMEPEGSYERRVHIEAVGGEWDGFRIDSHDGKLCYGIEVAWLPGDPNRMRFEARVPGKSLEIERSFRDGIVTEIYRFEGRVDTLCARGPFDLTDPGAPVWTFEPGSHRDTPWSRRVRCAEQRWLRLDRNVEGARLADLVWRSGLAAWLATRLGAQERGTFSRAPCLLCLCWFGTGESPLCGSCLSPEAVESWASVAAFLEKNQAGH